MTETVRFFGPIAGVPVGTVFRDRKSLRAAGVHLPPMHGISGNGAEGADSIVISGGYEDDEDHGDIVIYTGQGGNDLKSRTQFADQELVAGNLALVRSELFGLPVRVIRGIGCRPGNVPLGGYRYDGVFRVESHWRERGRAGFFVWRFRLVRLPEAQQVAMGQGLPSADLGSQFALEGRPSLSTGPRRLVAFEVCRPFVETAASRFVKSLHDYTCQVCSTRLKTPAGPYAEGAHIVPLHDPHKGPDVPENILCLCPNDRLLFGMGAFSVDENLALVGRPGRLRSIPRHPINPHFLAHHRERLWSCE